MKIFTLPVDVPRERSEFPLWCVTPFWINSFAVRLGAFFQCTLAPKYRYKATEKLYPVKYLIPWLNNPAKE